MKHCVHKDKVSGVIASGWLFLDGTGIGSGVSRKQRVASDGNHLREIIQRTQTMWDLAGNGNTPTRAWSLGYILPLYNARGRESSVEIIMCWSKREVGYKGPRYSSIFHMLPLIFQQMSFFYCAYFSQCVRF